MKAFEKDIRKYQEEHEELLKRVVALEKKVSGWESNIEEETKQIRLLRKSLKERFKV